VEDDVSVHSWNSNYEATYNSIQQGQLALRKEIERNIRKIINGKIPWSPKLQRYHVEIELWSMVWKKRQDVKVSNDWIRKFMQKPGIWTALKYNLKDISK
jgi:hypothetical protein